MKSGGHVVLSVLVGIAAVAAAPRPVSADSGGKQFTVVPFEFDPYQTRLVEAEWEDGIGCPTMARIEEFIPPAYTMLQSSTYTDPACATGDPKDRANYGLMLFKTGPTNNDASAGATLQGVKGVALTELGYDIRKPGTFADQRGSHCGAGAPRFNIVIDNQTYFIGCASPPPDVDQPGVGWQRLRWGGAAPLMAFNAGTGVAEDIKGRPVRSIEIVFDEGQDTPGDQFGAAILDNIDVNGSLAGRGPEGASEQGRDEGHGEDKDHRHYEFHHNQSRPESSSMSYQDRNEGVKVQSINGSRATTYNGACVSFVADALFNGDPDYIVTFASCDLSGVPALLPGATPNIGNYSIVVTGPAGVVYQKAGDLVSGAVSIHK